MATDNLFKKQVQKVISSVNQDKINIKANEPPDQFGMKNGTFKIIMGNPSQQTYNSPLKAKTTKCNFIDP
ncbi:hypothetical protein CDQ96_04285 (plasmid) [Borrelia miyamotoi]|uniref:hypothetical protein n=1 Tax=Borrelia miyamotoi TaxID=47466 RepID=UPI000B8D3CE4|nr:hypothetical protein [Borrelia miyamotoi]ASQ29630.1 hypothetical protein CDQ96_04285 [Borrelia miyamotoi]